VARRIVSTFLDDMTGHPGDDVARHTFSLDGVQYEIDLNADSYQRLLDVLAPYFRCGRKTRSPRRRSQAAAEPAHR
jgi:hypothetical protein